MLKHSDILGSLLPFAACCTKVRLGPEVPSATAYQNTLFEEVCRKRSASTLGIYC